MKEFFSYFFGKGETVEFENFSFANQLIGPGANYLYMAKPEDTPSILDILPPNFALRILIMAAAVTALFFLAYLPWLILDRRAAKKKAPVVAE